MPRRNPKEINSSRGWKGRLGRKARGTLYVTKFDKVEKRSTSVKPGDVIEVLVQSVNRRGEGEGTYNGRAVIIIGAADPGLTVMAKVRRVAEGKIIAEVVESE